MVIELLVSGVMWMWVDLLVSLIRLVWWGIFIGIDYFGMKLMILLLVCSIWLWVCVVKDGMVLFVWLIIFVDIIIWIFMYLVEYV